ncbi:unnamed protein product [Brachionus calyciflorus]|uniref:Uncharacterized protein n=1 Tax=Brachionus calyciflorus TaxID=104777 RepID=A0A813XJR6_9BILA|nr:unnamed protein product [Brachionus calyciflorus]
MNHINLIVSYYDELINQIDESTEIVLSKSDNAFHDTINTKRNNLINCVKKHLNDSLQYYESIKNQMNNNKDNKEEIFSQIFKTRFCFFIPSIKKADFLPTKEIGKLVITNQYLPMENTFDQLDNLINLDQIEELDIAFDGIEELYSEWFEKFQSIKKLFVGGDSLKLLKKNNFNNLQNIESIYFCNAPLEYIDEYTFEGLNTLKYLSFTWGCLDKSDSKIVLKKPENLESINFLKNKLNSFTKETLEYENLKILILNENNLKLIDKDAFSNLKNLEIIYIINNGASIQIDPSAFEGLDKLEVLDLKNSEIFSIDHLNLRDLTNLNVLGLSNNFLKNINLEVINRFIDLEVLDLIGNPELEVDIDSINLHNLRCLLLEKTRLKNLDKFPKLQVLEINNLISLDSDCFNFKNSIDYLKLGIAKIDVNSINLSHFNGLQNMVFIELNSENSNILNSKNLERFSSIFSSLIELDKCETQTDIGPVCKINARNSISKKNFMNEILNISTQVKQFFSDNDYF